LADRPGIAELKENQTVEAEFLVLEKNLQTTRTGSSYLALVLGDQTGRMAGRVWEGAEKLDRSFTAGDVVLVRGRVSAYKGQLQLNVAELKPLAPDQAEPGRFMPSSKRPPGELLQDLTGLAAGLGSPFKEVCLSLLQDDELGPRLLQAPAAKSVHHAYRGGLLEHTLSVARLAEMVAGHYPFLHRDLLLSGAILHDLGKALELDLLPAPDYTDQGRLVGHVVLSLNLFRDHLPADFPPELAAEISHLILSHHGLKEFGSPTTPQTLEAVALNLCDDLDAKLSAVRAMFEESQEDWTDYSRIFDRYFYKGSPARPEPDGEPRPKTRRRGQTQDQSARSRPEEPPPLFNQIKG